jgi:hypothetical protein
VNVVAIDTAKLNKSAGTEISGALGLTTFWKMVIRIDYRNGLVELQYKPD